MQKLAEVSGIGATARLIAKITKRHCKCGTRRAYLNRRFPYKKKP